MRHFSFLYFQTKCIPIICHFRLPTCYIFYVCCQPFVYATSYRGGTKWGALGQPSPHSPPYIFRSSGVHKNNPKESFYKQWCVSGSVGSICFWASGIHIRILLSSSKNSRINIDSYRFVTLYDFLSLKNDVNVPSKSNKHKNSEKKIYVDILKITDENGRIRIRIRIWIWIRIH